MTNMIQSLAALGTAVASMVVGPPASPQQSTQNPDSYKPSHHFHVDLPGAQLAAHVRAKQKASHPTKIELSKSTPIEHGSYYVFTPDRKHLLIVDSPHTLVMRLSTGEPVKLIQVHRDIVDSPITAPDGSFAVITSGQFPQDDSSPVEEFVITSNEKFMSFFSPRSRSAISTPDPSRGFAVYDSFGNPKFEIVTNHYITPPAFGPDGIYYGDGKMLIKLDSSGKTVWTKEMSNDIEKVVLAKNGTIGIVAKSENLQTVQLLDSQGNTIHASQESADYIQLFPPSPKGDFAWLMPHTLYSYDSATKREHTLLPADEVRGGVKSYYSPQGNLIVTTFDSIRAFASNGTQLWTIDGFLCSQTGFSPSGARIAYATEYRVGVFDVTTKKNLGELEIPETINFFGEPVCMPSENTILCVDTISSKLYQYTISNK